MSAEIRTRQCAARDVTDWASADARRRLLAGACEAGFTLIESFDWPANQTCFEAAADTQALYLSVLVLQAGNQGRILDGLARDVDTVEVLLDPRNDQLGMLQFGVGESGKTYENSHWPYLDPACQPPPDLPWSVRTETEHQGPDILRFHYFRFDRQLFAGRAVIGLNVCRYQSGAQEASSWNPVSGLGFPDPDCFGQLSLGVDCPPPSTYPAVSRAGHRVQLQGTYDWPDHILNVPYSPATLQREMCWYRELGLARVSWLDYDRYDPAAISNPKSAANAQQAIANFGSDDFLPAAVAAAHAAGLAFHTLFKPFDLTRTWVNAVIADDPAHQMRRHPDWARPLRGAVERVTFRAGPELGEVTAQLWAVTGDGWQLIDCNSSATWQNLRLATTQLAVVVAANRDQVTIRNRVYRLAEVMDAEQSVDWTCRIAASDEDTPGEDWWQIDRGPWHEAAWARLDTGRQRLLALQAKKIAVVFDLQPATHLPRVLEPTDPAVQDLWLRYLQRGLDAGADGVGVRIAHHQYCDDWQAFMFAAPALAAFRDRFGRDCEPHAADAAAMQQLRGDAFTDFLRQAKAAAADAGKPLSLHLENRMLCPPDAACYTGIWWNWRQWIKDGLADEIDLKYLGPGHPVVRREVLPLAREHGVKVNWITADPEPRSRPRSLNEVELLAQRALAAGLDGLNLYELWLYRRVTDDGYAFSRGSGEGIIRKLYAALQAGA